MAFLLKMLLFCLHNKRHTRVLFFLIHVYAEFFAASIKEYGLEKKVCCITTDNAANCRLARKLLIAMEGFKHLQQMPCQMHALNLLLQSVMNHPELKELVKMSSGLTYFIGASHAAGSALRKGKKIFKKTRGLAKAGDTRFTAVHRCLQSVLELKRPLQYMAEMHPELFAKKEAMLAVLTDSNPKSTEFFQLLAAVDAFLEPISQAVMAVQRDGTTLSDCCRYWLYLLQKLTTLVEQHYREPGPLSKSVIAHIAASYFRRVKGLDVPLLRLALFLDPRIRTAMLPPAAATETSDDSMRARLLPIIVDVRCQELLTSESSDSSSVVCFLKLSALLLLAWKLCLWSCCCYIPSIKHNALTESNLNLKSSPLTPCFHVS